MKMAFYVISLVGLVALALGVYWLVKNDHHYRQYISLVVGAVLLVGGLVASFVVKPKSQTTA